jgi:hypothetical protein
MTDATVGIEAVLRDDHPVVREKGHRDFAAGGITGDERRYIADDRSFADSLTDIRITAAGHPFAVELDFQFVVTQGEHAKIVAKVFVDAFDLRSTNQRPAFCSTVWAAARFTPEHSAIPNAVIIKSDLISTGTGWAQRVSNFGLPALIFL